MNNEPRKSGGTLFFIIAGLVVGTASALLNIPWWIAALVIAALFLFRSFLLVIVILIFQLLTFPIRLLFRLCVSIKDRIIRKNELKK